MNLPFEIKQILIWCLAQSNKVRLQKQDRRTRIWQSKNRVAYLASRRNTRLKTLEIAREKGRRSMKKWRVNNPDAAKAHDKEMRLLIATRRASDPLFDKHCRSTHAAQARKYRNTDEFRNRQREKRSLRCKTDIGYKLLWSARQRLFEALRGSQKKQKTIELIGCSTGDLKAWLENQFAPGMSWENYGSGQGKWEIDHRVPCAAFDLSREDELRRCFHFSNLRPMWGHENRKKRHKIGVEFDNVQPTLAI